VIGILYIDKVIKNGAEEIRLAKVAPAPSITKSAGRAQQISVEEAANKENRFTALSFTTVSVSIALL
jgi:hypothetical protein